MALFHCNHVICTSHFVLFTVARKKKLYAQYLLERLRRYLELANIRPPCNPFDPLVALPQFRLTSTRWPISRWLLSFKQSKKSVDKLHHHAGVDDATRNLGRQHRDSTRHFTVLHAFLKSEDQCRHSETCTCAKTVLPDHITRNFDFSALVFGGPTPIYVENLVRRNRSQIIKFKVDWLPGLKRKIIYK